MLTRPDDDGVTIGELRKPQFAVQQEVVQVDVGAPQLQQRPQYQRNFRALDQRRQP